MLDVITTSFYIKAPEFRKQEFEFYSTELFDEWDKYVEATLQLPDYALALVVEEGSIKGRGKIVAAAAGLYFAIGAYGDFVSGLQTLREQATFVSNALFDQAKKNFGCNSSRGNSKRAGGEVFFLENLFERVQRGQITPDQAMERLRARWGEESVPKRFMEDLESNLRDAPRYPQQLTLSDESWEDCPDINIMEKSPKTPAPRSPDPPLPSHYRIEIYRPSKGDKKKVKLTKIR